MKISFFKYQALLNDYIIIDKTVQNDLAELSENTVRYICDRRRGIGADGILELYYIEKTGYFYMKIINSDGSVAKMCGNGLRSIVKFLFDTNRVGLNENIEILTDSGVKSGTVLTSGKNTSIVKVNLGQTEILETDLMFHGYNFTMVDVGNPHIVTFLNKDADIRQLAVSEGGQLEKVIEGGVNVGFARIKENYFLELAVWERGAGFTMACGTGATAAATVAMYLGFVPKHQKVTVNQPGGDLEILKDESDSVILTGEASFVFKGEIEI